MVHTYIINDLLLIPNLHAILLLILKIIYILLGVFYLPFLSGCHRRDLWCLGLRTVNLTIDSHGTPPLSVRL